MRTAILLAHVAICPSVLAQSFQGLGDLPGGNFSSGAVGVSADGAAVAGSGAIADGESEAFRWAEATGMVGLGDLPGGFFRSFGTGISDDGTTVVGESVAEDNIAMAFRWRAGGMLNLGDLPGGGIGSTAYDVSADGAVVVGGSISADGNEAFRWTAGGGMVGLGDLPGGGFSSVAEAVSADGSVVAGTGLGAVGSGEAFRWTVAGGMVGLGTLPGDVFSRAYAVSSDGSIVVGISLNANGTYRAVRWTPAGGIEALEGCVGQCHAFGVSDDGATIVGLRGNEAFIWTEDDGMRNLKTVLETEYGLDLTGWTLQFAGAISPDGTVIVGRGLNPAGQGEAWRAVLGGQCEEPLALRSWIDPLGGPFADPNNWSASTVPGNSDRALFGLSEGADYTVTFAAIQGNDQLLLRGGNHVRFALAGQSYSVVSTGGCGPALDVADEFQTPRLEIEGGSFVAVGGAEVAGPFGTAVVVRQGAELTLSGGLRLAPEADQSPDLVVESGGVFVATGSGDVVIGGDGSGKLTVEGGGSATLAVPVRAGEGAEGTGLVLVAGSAANLSVPGAAAIGYGGYGSLQVRDGAEATVGELTLGRLAGGEGRISVESSGTVEATTLAVGVEGQGNVALDGFSSVLVSQGFSVPGGTGQGNVYAEGLGALIRAGILRVGMSGQGTFTLRAGSLAEVGQLLAGSPFQAHVNLSGGCLRIGGGDCETARGGSGGTLEADTVWVGPGATLDSLDAALGPAGVLGGAGTLPLDLTNAGTINPGDSAGVAGTFTIGGGYTQAPTGVLEAELAGATSHDVLSVTGAATLDGTLRFRYLGGFNPSPGDAFTVLTAGSVAGEFASVEGPAGSTYSVAYGPTSVTATVLTVDDEPGPTEAGLVLHPPVPNPSAARTSIRYDLPVAGNVRLAIHDALGREVAVAVDGRRPAGPHEAAIDVSALATGIYFVRLATDDARAIRPLSIAR